MQQQRKTDGAAEEFGKVSRHRRHFADDPKRDDHRLRKMLPAHFGQIAPGDDAELGRQRLIQHGDDVGHEHDPQQRITVFRAGLDVGREIAGIHIGDRGDHRGAGEQQRAVPAHLAGQHLANAFDGPFGHDSCSRCSVTHRRSPASPTPRLHNVPIATCTHCYVIVNGLQDSAKAECDHLVRNKVALCSRGCIMKPPVIICYRRAARGLGGHEESREEFRRRKARNSQPSRCRPTVSGRRVPRARPRCSRTTPN